MAISHTCQEALNKLRATRPTEPITTFFETLFLESISNAHRAPLLRNALALFNKHWTCTDGANVQVHTHDAVELLTRTAAKWWTDILRSEASAAHAANLQIQVATLEYKLVNPAEEVDGNIALKARGSADTRTQNAF